MIAATLSASVAVACASSYSGVETPTPADASASPCGIDACPANACGVSKVGCGVIDCGGCAATDQCVDGVCRCAPRTCAELGAECGATPDGCGGQLYCGGCLASPPPQDAGKLDGAVGDAGGDAGSDAGALTCGANNHCASGPCTPKAPSAACFSPTVRLCAAHPDGCGSVVDCGTSACTGVGETCGGGGVAGQCGCKPKRGCTGSCYDLCDDGCGKKIPCNCNNCH